MPRDITKEEANSDWSTSIIEFGETAASVTAGAAVLYRGLSGRKVSRLSNRYIRKIKALDRTISSRNYDDWNKKEIRSVYNSLKDQFQQIERTPSDGVILGNNKNPRSVFESISKAFKLIDEADIGAIGKSQAMSRIDENIRRYALQQLQENLPEHLQIDEQNIEKFVRDLLRTIHLNNDRTEYVANTFDANAVLWRYRRKSYGRSPEEHGLNRNKNVVDKIAQNIQQYAIDIKNSNIDALKQKGNGEIERNIAKELLKIEALEKQTGSGKYETSMSKLKDSALGDSSATIGQILDAYNDATEDDKRRLFIGFDYRALRQAEDNSNSKYIYEPVNVLNKLTEYLEQLSEEERKRFRNIKADPYIRFDGSNIYSLNEIADLKDKAMDILSGTMVGKILKLRDIHEGSKVPSVFEIRAGSLNPLSAGVLNETEDKKRLENTYWYIHGNIFEQAEDGTLIKSEKYSGDVVARSGRLGTTSRLVRSMFGMESHRDMTGKPILDYLDIGTTTDINILQDIRSFFGVRTDDRVNMEGRLKRAIENPHPNLVVQYRTDKKIMDFLDSNILELNHETVQKLLDAETNEADKDILRLIQTDFTSIDNSSLIDVIIGRNADGNAPYLNQELNTLITRFQKDEWKTADILKLQRDQSKAYYHGDSIGLRLDDILRMELGKEYFLRKAVSVQNKNKIAGFDIIKEIIENAGLSNESEYAAKKMGYYAYTDYLTGIFHDRTTDSSAEEVQKAVDMFRGMFFATDKNSGYYDAGETFKKVAADQNSFLDVEKFKYDTDTIPEISPDYVVLKEGVGPLALIRAANESIRTGDNSIFGDRIKDFFKQFIAGRNTPEDVTTYTMAPYFFTHRLGTGLNYFGLGFSNSSTGSVIDMWKTILFKRIALSGAIATELDWVSDTFGAITGTPGSAAIVNGFANVDLGLRKVSDTLGITGLIDGAMDFAPFSYLSDGNTFNSYEEEKKYYESGYEPIRKGRYWFFGSANEFRGGQIEYFRPNLTRRLNSDYYNKSLYSGYWDKWGHSLLPTPAMPFSPLIYALDPYYLENEHKYDRPYPVSAPMFSENTPWGIVLNPTIGELIKPKTKLNTDRMDDGSDVLALIANINNQIRQTVLDDTEQNSIILNNGKLTPSIYVAYDHPTPNQIIYRPGYSGSRYINSDGEIDFDSTFGIPEEGVNMEEYAEAIENNKGNIIASRQDGFISRNESRYGSDRLGILDNAMLKSSVFRYPAEIIKGVISNVESTITGHDNSGYNYSGALSVIAQANKDIRERAIAGDNGIFVGDKLSYNRSSINEIVNKDTEIQELVNRGSGYDLVHQTATATRLVAGIYGYMGNELLGLGDFNNKHIANAGNIDSFARSFWDASIGGLGGEVSEIARRFIPEYRRRTELNPLLNNMPEWMPERFRIGDPYCVTSDTLIEIGNLGFEKADTISQGDLLLSHKGRLEEVEAVAVRPVKETENIYEFTFASLSCIKSKYSENHPILICKHKEVKKLRSGGEKNISDLIRLNAIIDCLQLGIISKQEICNITGINKDWMYLYWKRLSQDNIIEDYKKNRNNVFPIKENLRKYNIELEKKRLQWTCAKNISIGDYAAYPLPEYKEKDIIIDMAEITPYPHSDEYIYISGQMKHQDSIEIYEWMLKNGIPKFKRGERKKFLEENKWDEHHYEGCQGIIRYNRKIERMPRFITITPELAYAIGLYIAEGYSNNSVSGYALHEEEENLFLRAVNGIIESGVHVSNYRFKRIKMTHGATGCIYSKPFVFLINYLTVAKGAHNKRIHDIFWNAKKDIILKLFEGYFDGDGSTFRCQTGEGKKDSYRVSLASCNMELLLQVRKLALRFGFVFSINKKEDRPDGVIINGRIAYPKNNYSLILRGQSAIEFTNLVWDKDEPEHINVEKKSSSHTFIYNGYVYIRVNNIRIYTKNDYPEVFGYQISNSRSFCTAGIATHNTSIPYGEARLPGKGYEALNQLHPDQYGYYGALDRFKILADVAPYSEELKIWRKLAFHEYRGNTEVLKEIDEIQERINEQSKVHDFYDYRFIGKNAEYKQAVVSKVMDNGTFMIVGSDEVHKLAGVDFNNYDDSSQELLSQFIGPGAQITIATDSNQYHKYDSNGNVNAAVFIDGESLSETLYDEKLVKKRKGTTNAADVVAMHSGLGRTAGYVLEALAHTEVPLLSSRWLKIQSPIESYKDEQIYGTSYQSWSDIIGTTIMPSWYKAISDPWAGVKETMSFAMLHHFHKQNITGLTKASMVSGAMSLVNRGAFMGGAIAYFIKPDDGDLFKKGQKIGALASLAGNLYTSTQGSYLGAAANWGLAGFMVGDLLDDSKTKENRAALESSLENKLENTAKTYGEDSINHEVQKMENSILKFVRGSESIKFRGKYTLAGAGIGVALAGIFGNGVFSDEDHWIPEKTKKKWEIEDYFDRLTYLKYMGLYEQAARKAYSEEGISVKKIVDELDAAQTDAQTIKDHLRDLIAVAQNHNLSNDTENKEIIEANTRLNQIRSSQLILKGGAYTRAALMYKQAAEATMYGLKDNASWQEIAQALPKYERDYFVEFMKEKDPEEQEKILREASPFMRRALKQVWKYDDYKDEQKEDNTEFFSHHNLPGPFSDIWNPEVNLNDVKAKVVKNEGLLSSDFGIYESQYKEASTINAPNITMNGNQNILELQLELATILNGNGLVGTDVRIEPTSTNGIKSVINVAKVTNYNVGEMVRDAI